MVRFDRNALGTCDFLDVLEETVLMHARAKVELLDGTSFEDRIRDLTIEDGQDVVIFADHDPVEVREIAAITREPLPHGYPRDPRRDPVPHRRS